MSSINVSPQPKYEIFEGIKFYDESFKPSEIEEKVSAFATLAFNTCESHEVKTFTRLVLSTRKWTTIEKKVVEDKLLLSVNPEQKEKLYASAQVVNGIYREPTDDPADKQHHQVIRDFMHSCKNSILESNSAQEIEADHPDVFSEITQLVKLTQRYCDQDEAKAFTKLVLTTRKWTTIERTIAERKLLATLTDQQKTEIFNIAQPINNIYRAPSGATKNNKYNADFRREMNNCKNDAFKLESESSKGKSEAMNS